MENLNQIRMLTANFSLLQGLKQIPLGLLLLLVTLWANVQSGPAEDIFFPLSASLLFFYLYWLVHKFYGRTYGRVIPTTRQRRREVMIALVGSGAALAAFWVDVSLDLPFSSLGVVFAGAVIVEFARISRHTKEDGLVLYPLAALGLIVLSTLPILGVNWWAPLGFKALLFGICSAAGLSITVLGVVGHISLENLLMHNLEAANEPRV